MKNTVIFDMDGTLYDTECIYRDGWLFAGVPLELYRSFIGTGSAFIIEQLEKNGMDPDVVIRRKESYVARELEKGIPLKRGSLEVLRWLTDHGWKSAIATSSTMETADFYLDSSGLRPYFTEVVSGNHLEHGKPAPDIFLMTADRLGADSSECVVVEDSFNGVRAGHAAGMYTVMIPDLVEPTQEIRNLAHQVLESLEDLPAVLESLEDLRQS